MPARSPGWSASAIPFIRRQSRSNCAPSISIGLKTPTLICQGTRDEFGTRDEVPGYGLSKSIDVLWLEDGDHDLKPRKSISGFSAADHLKTVAEAVAAFARQGGAVGSAS